VEINGITPVRIREVEVFALTLMPRISGKEKDFSAISIPGPGVVHYVSACFTKTNGR
jgi:hypothetical protein